jgi:hypothetical protein
VALATRHAGSLGVAGREHRGDRRDTLVRSRTETLVAIWV